jgi:hypothetical protein
MLTLRPKMPFGHAVPVTVRPFGDSFAVFQDGVYRGMLKPEGVARAILSETIHETDLAGAGDDYVRGPERC